MGLPSNLCEENKTKEIYVCANFSTRLNRALKSYHYSLPRPDEIFSKLSGGKIFSKIDLSDAYLQIPVNKKCSELLTVSTHRGMYTFGRLLFRVKVAPAIFQQIMHTMLSGLDFVVAYLTDILINSENIEQHKKYVHAVFRRIKDNGSKLNDEVRLLHEEN